MTSLGFENYGEALKIYLARYREVSAETGLKPHIPAYSASDSPPRISLPRAATKLPMLLEERCTTARRLTTLIMDWVVD